MGALFNLFLDICLLRKGPQDVPASPVLLKLTLLAYGISGVLVMLVTMQATLALLQTLFDMALLTGLTYAVLEWQGRGARFGQTLTALMGAGSLLGLIALPVVIWIGEETNNGSEAELPSLLFFVLLGWSIAVIAHVLQHALSTTLGVGVLYALAYLCISMVLSSLLLSVG